ncbi:hypothetical protein GGI13_004238 [Coemansia sp. RSA 455]|nr:hypothetical protein H4S03_005174 [Coemansia sp. S3946]KAJ2069712.1 hypothetical protein GGI08_000213 [Coemansia sp. S2]KAJ2249567.1 hypothetical protein GGI13_004238 [Coemansia sp. RSA 455]KAJ2347819.1 hypothetical protein GGH92_003055 [Coemansia sp. RSA 2673]KAJ2423783.1 hypothetical protein GGF41_003006 [Coemansia sp. RSA 2531]KAJ2468399.1 hypothetical protein GGI03_001018 [Coemansia sp. RSA 2337]
MSASSSKQRRERRQRQQKRQQSERQQQQPRVVSCAAAMLPDNILRLIFVYLKPILPLGSSGTLMLHQLARLKKVAKVNRQWRAVATQLFYRVAVVVITKPQYDYDESRMRSNIRLIRDMDQVSSVRELQIVMESGGQPVHELTRCLTAAGLGKCTWPGVVR